MDAKPRVSPDIIGFLQAIGVDHVETSTLIFIRCCTLAQVAEFAKLKLDDISGLFSTTHLQDTTFTDQIAAIFCLGQSMNQHLHMLPSGTSEAEFLATNRFLVADTYHNNYMHVLREWQNQIRDDLGSLIGSTVTTRSSHRSRRDRVRGGSRSHHSDYDSDSDVSRMTKASKNSRSKIIPSPPSSQGPSDSFARRANSCQHPRVPPF